MRSLKFPVVRKNREEGAPLFRTKKARTPSSSVCGQTGNFRAVKNWSLVVLGCVFFGIQCVFAYQPEEGFWAQRRRASQRQASPLVASLPFDGREVGNSVAASFPAVQSVGASLARTVSRSVPQGFLKDHSALWAALSPAHGTVRKVSLPQRLATGAPVVIHIHDVHMNQEAQWNIRETVRSLFDSGQVDLMGLEGATGEISLSSYADFPDRGAVEATANYLLKENKITGPIHAAITGTQTPPRIIGIDDPAHYAANVRAYIDSSSLLGKTRQNVRTLQDELERRKTEVFSHELRRFDARVRSHHKGEISLGDHVLSLSEASGGTLSSSLQSFVHALTLEREMDFTQVEKERATLIGDLTVRMDERETNDLFANSLAYRSGHIRYSEFYLRLKRLCESKNVSLSRFPAMEDYVRYVLTADGIDAERLIDDIAHMEKRGYDRLVLSNEEKVLLAQSRRAYLTEKLVDFSLSPKEWKEFKTTGSAGERAELVSFETFYREAEARDRAMTENLMKDLAPDGLAHGKTAILVTGGFHAEGMTERLVHQGAVVVSYVPKIEKIETPQGSSSLSVFTQEKTPLEKLFAGKKLFLGMNPAAGMATAPVLIKSVSQLDNRSFTLSAAERGKIDEYLKRFFPGVQVRMDEPVRTEDGGWLAVVHVTVEGTTQSFTLVTNKKFEIKSFGVTDEAERPAFAWLMDAVIWGHARMGPFAQKISKWTEAVLFSTLSVWTPANFLWLSQRHTIENELKLTLLLVWMAITSIQSIVGNERAVSIREYLTRAIREFNRQSNWNSLGLVPLAANVFPVKERNPPYQRRLGFKELKIVGKQGMQDVLNGHRTLVGRVLIISDGLYLVLWKKEKKTDRLKLDITGGGTSGRGAGISVSQGIHREVMEEISFDLPDPLANSTDVALASEELRIFSITGPNSNPLERRAMTMRRVILNEAQKKSVVISKEHEGFEWLTLAEILQRFSELNTGPRMVFYVEFLREAYGIMGVRSLIPLNDGHRLKSLSDSVIIETDSKRFLFCAQTDLTSPQEMKKLFPHLEIGRVVKRKPEPANPDGTAIEEIIPPTFTMRELKNVRDNPIAVDFGRAIVVTPVDPRISEKLKGSRETRLLTSLPNGATARLSVRLLVRNGEKYGFILVSNHKNECVGGVGQNQDRDGVIDFSLEQLRNTLGVPIERDSLSLGDSPLLTHSIDTLDQTTEYVRVFDGVVDLNQEIPAGRENGLVWLSYDQMKQNYLEFTLATRMLILKEIIFKEYGYKASNIKPLKKYTNGQLYQLLVETDRGTFVFRKADTTIDTPEATIEVDTNSKGKINYYVLLGKNNFLLVKYAQDRNYPDLSYPPRDYDSAILNRDLIPVLRSIAHNIQRAPIWGDLLKAQQEIAFKKKHDPGQFLKHDSSPVTEWDFRLQLAFLEFVKGVFPDAHVVGEENLLNEKFLKSLSDEKQVHVRKLLRENGGAETKGFLFFVDPIDGTRNFTDGGAEFSFTFGVLQDGRPVYAATFVPGSKSHDLYEADAVHGKIFKNENEISFRRIPEKTLVKLQRGFDVPESTLDSLPFDRVDRTIPSIAYVAAESAAGEGATALVLNPGAVPPWDFVPAAIFFRAAGFKVTNFNGEDILSGMLSALEKGQPLKAHRSQLAAALDRDHDPLLQWIRTALKGKDLSGEEAVPSGVDGVATGVAMIQLFEWLGAMVDQHTRKFKSTGGTAHSDESSYTVRFGLHYKRNAPRYEFALAVTIMVANLFWAGTPWVGGLFSLIFLASHAPIFKPQTVVQVSWGKVAAMAVIYGALISFTPEALLDFLQGKSPEALANLLLIAAGWHGAFGLHRYFDPPWRTAKPHESIHVEIKPLALSYWTSRALGVPEPLARFFGGAEMMIQIPALIWLRLSVEVASPTGAGFIAFLGLDPFLGPIFVASLFYLLWGNYSAMSKAFRTEGNDTPPLKHLVGPLAVFLFLIPTPMGLGMGAMLYLFYFMSALVDLKPEPRRILSAEERSKKGRILRLLASLPRGINPTDAEVKSVRVIIKIVEEGVFKKIEKFLFVQNQDGRWEFPGGGGHQDEQITAVADREIHEELGYRFADVLKISKSDDNDNKRPQFFHDINAPDKNSSYRAVSVVHVDHKGYSPRIKLNTESLSYRWMSLKRAMRMYMGFTLNTRMALLNPILESEYGIGEIQSIVPLEEDKDVGVIGHPLLITTRDKKYVFRHQDQRVFTAIQTAEHIVPRKKTFFQRSNVLRLSRQPMVLVEVIDPSEGSGVSVLPVGRSIARPKEIADGISLILKGQPISLGVEGFRASVLRVAEGYSRYEGGMNLSESPVSIGTGNNLFFVDSVSLADRSSGKKLLTLLKAQRNLTLVVPQKVLGLPEGRVIVMKDAFNLMEKGADSLFVVDMGRVESQLPLELKKGPLQIMQTPFLTLNYDTLSSESWILKAKKSALVIVLESMRVFSAEAFRWGDVLNAMRALAEAA